MCSRSNTINSTTTHLRGNRPLSLGSAGIMHGLPRNKSLKCGKTIAQHRISGQGVTTKTNWRFGMRSKKRPRPVGRKKLSSSRATWRSYLSGLCQSRLFFHFILPSAAFVKSSYWGKQFPNAISSLSGPSSRTFRRSNAHTMFFSFFRKPIHVCESAVTCRSGRPTCPSATLSFCC
jgi:hypothetical protein